MNELYHEGKTFEKTDYKSSFPKGEYENCVFSNCEFAEADLSGSRFINCRFVGCNLSMANWRGTVLNGVHFKDSKMLAMRFNHCNGLGFAVSFDTCQLQHSSFYQMRLRNTLFSNCKLQEVDFSESDLSGAVLDNCDLGRAIFDRTGLEKADLRTAYNFSINPENNRVKKAKFSLSGLVGLLEKYGIVVED